jgi:hypothetical protein
MASVCPPGPRDDADGASGNRGADGGCLTGAAGVAGRDRGVAMRADGGAAARPALEWTVSGTDAGAGSTGLEKGIPRASQNSRRFFALISTKGWSGRRAVLAVVYARR